VLILSIDNLHNSTILLFTPVVYAAVMEGVMYATVMDAPLVTVVLVGLIVSIYQL
jgi:hypothetical protein